MKAKKPKSKRIHVGYIEIDLELYKELRWIVRRDRVTDSRVTFKSLIVQGLYHARDASYIPAEDEPQKPEPAPDSNGGAVIN